jgi:putative intracellular protease/amidase
MKTAEDVEDAEEPPGRRRCVQYSRRIMRFAPVLLVSLAFCAAAACYASDFRYIRQGNPHDVQTRAEAGVAMMGGGADLDEAFHWLCGKANGGDFLIVRAHGGPDYNPYVNGLCKANSVATLIISSWKAAQEPRVAEIIGQAEVIFIAGGDQSRYVNFWKGTPVEDAINAHVAAGKPIGGTSAGLAVLGQFVYGCLEDKPDDPDLTSHEVLANPYIKRVTVVRNFLKVLAWRIFLPTVISRSATAWGAVWDFWRGLCRMAGLELRERLPSMRNPRCWWKVTAGRRLSAQGSAFIFCGSRPRRKFASLAGL